MPPTSIPGFWQHTTPLPPGLRWIGITWRLSYGGPRAIGSHAKQPTIWHVAACRLRYCPQYCKSVHRFWKNGCHKSLNGGGCQKEAGCNRSPANIHRRSRSRRSIVWEVMAEQPSGAFEAFIQMHPRHKGKPHISRTHVTYSTLQREDKVPRFLLLPPPPPIFGQLSFSSAHQAPLQLICSFMAAVTAFPLQTRSSCSCDSFGSMGNKISKTRAASGRLGQVTTLWWHGCGLNWQRAALVWRNERDPGAYIWWPQAAAAIEFDSHMLSAVAPIDTPLPLFFFNARDR